MSETLIDCAEWSNSLRDALPELVVAWQAAPVPNASLVAINLPLADELGLDPDHLSSADGLALLTGATPPDGTVAMAYAGHQFGSYSPLLGDGRAVLLGELLTPRGARLDVHLKGSGRTPFARGGDGKAALGPMLREYLVSEAMHALGVPTTRSLAVITTGEHIHRDGDGTGAILVRVAASHLRVGTFEYAARLPDPGVLRRLTDYTIERHHPHAAHAANPWLGLLEAVVETQAALVARWMLLGFVHGVMNTDNMTISGETIDYGPCAFMDRFDPDTVYSSIDVGGRYRYGHQPRIAQWNLTRLAEALLPLHDDVDAAIVGSQEILESFPERHGRHWNAGMRAKLGLVDEHAGDAELFAELFATMQLMEADLTLTFRGLAAELRRDGAPSAADSATPLAVWKRRWRDRLAVEGRDPVVVADALDDTNPLHIPRNHLVEEAIAAATVGDLEPFRRLNAVLADPYRPRPDAARYAEPADESFTATYRTFCGT